MQPFWDSFMREVQICADRHPYLADPKASDLGRWAACGLIGALSLQGYQPKSRQRDSLRLL